MKRNESKEGNFMKDIWVGTGMWEGWRLTTEIDGQPVLVDIEKFDMREE